MIIKLSPLFVVEIRVKNVPNDKYGPNGILFEVSIFFMPTKIIIINAADPKLRYSASIDSFEPKTRLEPDLALHLRGQYFLFLK